MSGSSAPASDRSGTGTAPDPGEALALLLLPALHEHVLVCEQCVDDVGHCDTGMALLRLIRDGGRAAAIIDRLAAPVVPCQPCLRAKITGLSGDHGCTGVAALADGQACPCCPKRGSR